MFWQSVLGGFAVLLHWQAWAAIAVYILLQMAWIIGIGMLMGGDVESGGRQVAGCLTHMIGGSIFQALALGGVIIFLTPIMLGGSHPIPLGFLTRFAWPISKACLFALIVTFILALIPIIGGLISNTPGVDTFIQGIIIFRIFSAGVIEHFLKRANIHVANLYPSFWASIGYLVIAIALVYTCVIAFSALGVTLSRSRYSGGESPFFFLGIALMPILGMLPLFMYANHVILAIHQVIK